MFGFQWSNIVLWLFHYLSWIIRARFDYYTIGNNADALPKSLSLMMWCGDQGIDNRQESRWGSGLYPCPSQLGLKFDTSDASRFAVRNRGRISIPCPLFEVQIHCPSVRHWDYVITLSRAYRTRITCVNLVHAYIFLYLFKELLFCASFCLYVQAFNYQVHAHQLPFLEKVKNRFANKPRHLRRTVSVAQWSRARFFWSGLRVRPRAETTHSFSNLIFNLFWLLQTICHGTSTPSQVWTLRAWVTGLRPVKWILSHT